MASDMSALVKKIKKQGWVVTIRRNGHYVFTAPTGEKVWAPATPNGGRRGIENCKAHLKRLGATV